MLVAVQIEQVIEKLRAEITTLSRHRVINQIANHSIKARVEQELALGFMYHLSGVPAFIIGGKYLVTGAQPLELLTQVVDKCIAENATV